MTLANIITSIRILTAVGLLFCPLFGGWFWGLYLVGGISDMIDGPIARKTHTASQRGAMLDSVADLIFVAVCLYRILPALALPGWLWIWIILIAMVKIATFIYAFIRDGKPVMPHTKANKLTGFLCFLLPVAIPFDAFIVPAAVVAAVAAFAAIHESITFFRRG